MRDLTAANTYFFLFLLFFGLVYFLAPSSSPPVLTTKLNLEIESDAKILADIWDHHVDRSMQMRYQVKNLACTYREHLYAFARNKSNTFEDLLHLHWQIDSLSLENGGEPADPYSWKIFDNQPPIKWSDNVFALRHADAPNVTDDFLICLPPKAGTSNWQIAFAKLFKTKEEMAAQGVFLAEDLKKNVFYPKELYGFVPRFHSVEHAALLEGQGKRYLNTRDPFTRARSGWRDKFQKYPDEPAMDKAYTIYNPLARKANRKHGPPPPPKFKVSFEKWLRYLIEDTKDKHMNNHWKPQDQICHFCAMDWEYIIHGRRSEVEWPWVVQKQHLDGILELSPRYGGPDPDSDWFDKEAQGFAAIPMELIKELYRRYYFDFVAAGYSPIFVEKFLSAVQNVQNNPDDLSH